MLENRSEHDKEVVILPDGNIDLFLTTSLAAAFHMTLLGMGTRPEQAVIQAYRTIFAISFKPLAIEYILKKSLADLVDTARNLPSDFWGFTRSDLDDFDRFVMKATQKISSVLPQKVDNRKHDLFDLIYSSNGAMPVSELSENVCWSPRQMNRYFNRQIGVSLKAYSNLIRFRSSFKHIKAGHLYPEQNFADQAHFIKEVKKLAGVNPKKLMINQNDRFIQFSTLPEE